MINTETNPKPPTQVAESTEPTPSLTQADRKATPSPKDPKVTRWGGLVTLETR